MDINYELYKVFYHVAHLLSFSEASKKLYISQSAVSQSIKLLEKRLDKTLFIRSTKKVSLTAEGEVLFKYIDSAVNLISMGESQLLECKHTTEETLKIGTTSTICKYFLLDYVNKLKKIKPDVHIKIICGTSYECVKNLEENVVDVIITNYPNDKMSRLNTVVEIKDFRDVLIANCDKTFKKKIDEISLKELENLSIILPQKETSTMAFLQKVFLSNSINVMPTIEINNVDNTIEMVKDGLGVGFIPDYCLKNLAEDVDVIKLKENIQKRKLVATYTQNDSNTNALRIFIDLLKHND